MVVEKINNEEFHDLCSSTNIVRVIQSRRIRRTERVARVGERRGTYRAMGVVNLRERGQFEDLGVERM